MTLDASFTFNKRTSENLFNDTSLQPPSKRHSFDLGRSRTINRSKSEPQSTKNSRSSSPIKYSRRHPYQYIQSNNKSKNSLTTKNLQLHTKHISVDNGLPSPITSPKKLNTIEISLVENKQNLLNNFAELSLLPSPKNGTCHQIFKTPEILDLIIKNLFILEKNEISDIEKFYSKESSQSYRQTLDRKKDILSKIGSLHQCAQVNKLWYELSMKYLLRNLSFKDSNKFLKFMMNSKLLYSNDRNFTNHPRSLMLYKLNHLKTEDLQMDLNSSGKIPFQDLKSLQLYICPNLLPIKPWFSQFKNLQKLSFPGNKQLNDAFMIEISLYLNKLQHLDLRACENVTDVGVVAIASRCKNLKLINLGRHKNGHAITDVSLVVLGKYTNVETIGVAGCSITDSGLWEFAKTNGENVKRLSLNKCKYLTNMSVPYLIGYNYFPKLVVLEIKNIENLTNMKLLAKFTLWRKSLKSPLLIESCDRLTQLINFEEEKLRKKRALISLREMSQWINEEELI